ncbi:hypothetical protein [Runella aurantiaca]|uniref:Uncharacterized protein n=1 Tax=Runella aurantiaca TaxID=2282308 RepID=A0A369IER3_9BACT|nr:hypothetical protein [Runella aurantiaca]RDB05983.1 hypothetical protein DVG78_11290 [Runella aurantiaca]
MPVNYNTTATKWALLIYSILTLRHFGIVLMLQFIVNPQFANVHENFLLYTKTYNGLMIWVGYVPAVLMLFSAISMIWLAPPIFPKWAVYISVVLGVISVATTLWVMMPIYNQWAITGYNATQNQQLLSQTLYFQIIPSALQVAILISFLHKYLQDVKPVAKWIFLLVVVLNFYNMGTTSIEGSLAYPLWETVGAKDWLAYRQTPPNLLFGIMFVFAAFSPIFLMIAMYWRRPKEVSKYLVTSYLLFVLYLFVITLLYFVPDFQVPLNSAYSLPLIKKLGADDLIYRAAAGLALQVIVAWMFLKIRPSILKNE